MNDRMSRGSKSATYETVRQVISRPPDQRKDFEVNSILPWFRSMKDTKVLGQLRASMLFDVIHNVQFVAKKTDELIVRQGDQGDCMYVMLRGKVTIYHHYGNTGDDGDAAVAQGVASKTGEELRQQLGIFVVTLNKPGTAFGEVALLTDNGTRSASIIADEPTDLIILDRELYNRSVQTVIRKEFEQKANFISQHPHFHDWAPKYRKQLTMALEKEILSFEHVVTKQAAPLDAIYFIVSGEVKMTMDPQQHPSQFPKLFAASGNVSPTSQGHITDDLRSLNSRIAPSEEGMVNASKANRKSSRRHQTVEVCLLGVNEAIGDIEVLMGLPSYMQTSICTQPCEVLVLNMKHVDRLLVRRNPKTIEALKQELQLRIESRITSRYLTSSVPLINCLLKRAAEYRVPPQQKTSRQNDGRRRGAFGQRNSAEVHAPGSVFYSVRQQQQNPSTRPTRSVSNMDSIAIEQSASGEIQQQPTPFDTTSDAPVASDSRKTQQQQQRGISQTQSHPSVSKSALPDIETSDGRYLAGLENRMQEWLNDERGITPKPQPILWTKTHSPRITTMRRASTEADHLRPGAKIVMKRRQIPLTPYPEQRESNDQDPSQPTEFDLDYYRTALSDRIPIFANNAA